MHKWIDLAARSPSGGGHGFTFYPVALHSPCTSNFRPDYFSKLTAFFSNTCATWILLNQLSTVRRFLWQYMLCVDVMYGTWQLLPRLLLDSRYSSVFSFCLPFSHGRQNENGRQHIFLVRSISCHCLLPHYFFKQFLSMFLLKALKSKLTRRFWGNSYSIKIY